MTGRTEELLERIALALEKLASDPVVEIESGPPLCPHCGAFNPTVRKPEEGEAVGPLGEFIIVADCGECGQTLYGTVESYSMHATKESVREEIEARRTGDNGQLT
jgi:hypothetical protein